MSLVDMAFLPPKHKLSLFQCTVTNTHLFTKQYLNLKSVLQLKCVIELIVRLIHGVDKLLHPGREDQNNGTLRHSIDRSEQLVLQASQPGTHQDMTLS